MLQCVLWDRNMHVVLEKKKNNQGGETSIIIKLESQPVFQNPGGVSGFVEVYLGCLPKQHLCIS